MASKLRPQRERMEEQHSKATEAMDEGSKYPGMSYEEGVQAALDWVLGNTGVPPMED